MTLGQSDRKRFTDRYHGTGASAYETVRQGAKWDAEEILFDELYALVQPKKVLDCPVGTGRFIDRYVRDGAEVVGVDLSEDMLAQSARKVPPGANVHLRQGDVLDAKGSPALGSGHDLIVCIRFIYAVTRADLPVLLRNFSNTGARHLLVGVRMWPEGAGAAKRAIWRVWNRRKRRPRWPFRRGRRYVPTERELLEFFHDGGWSVVERRALTEDEEAFSRYFFLLRRAD
jgi:hypothetical protein